MKQNYIYSFLFFFVSLGCFAQLPDFTLTVTATPETCPGNGTLTFTTSGTDPNANVVFSIYLLPDIIDPISTTPSNSLSGLDAGTYRVIATQTLGNLSNSQQQDTVIQSQATPLIFNVTGTDAICGNNGVISVSVTGGNPVSYEIFSGPILFAPQTTPSFGNLIAGTYSIRVIDACGQGIVRTFTILEPELSPEALTILENEFYSDMLVSCDLITVSHTINIQAGYYIAYPLTFTYTVYPPDGSLPLIVTNVLTETPGAVDEFITLITDLPYFEDAYTYNLVGTDVCGTEYVRNGNIINRQLSLQLQQVPVLCGNKNLKMRFLDYRLPITVAFLSSPAGFDPYAYSAQHPTFNGLPVYGSPTNGVPYGNYTVQITDGCGRTDIKTIAVTNDLSTPVVNSFYFTCAQGAGINIYIPGTPIATATITAAPTASSLTLPYNANSYVVNGSVAIRDILVPGNYTITLTDICNNSYTIQTTVPQLININLEVSYLGGCGTNEGSVSIGHMFIELESVIFNSGPAAYANGFPDDVSENIQMGWFAMGSLPSGIYQVSTRDDCDKIRNLTLFIGGYFGSTDVEITKNCTSFDLYFEHVNNNAVANEGFYLQLLNEVTGEWTHPYTGIVYPENTIPPDAINSLILSNGTLNTNITAIGHFRIFTPSYIYSSNPTELNAYCYHTIYEFDINASTTINSALNFSCSEGLSDVLLEVTGSGPFDFQIIEKDGQPFEVDNDEDPLFTNLETGVYLFQIEDSCGNQTPLIHDVSVPFVFGVTPFLCEEQNSSLSVPNFSYLEYEWFKQGAENTILSTSATLNINPLNLAADSGTYYVSISYPVNEESCLNQMLSYTISAGDAPNSGDDNQATLCTLPLTINLNDYLSGDYDENGTWEQINPGGTLTSNVWNAEGVANGTYSFKYIVNGFCGITDEATIAIEILVDMPNPQIATIDPICAGETINLTITNPDTNYSYSWTGPNNFTSNEPNPTIQNTSVEMSGTYIVTATRDSCQTTGSVEVVVNSLPDFYFANENIVICSGQNAEIEIRPTSTATIPYQFVWYFNNIEITGENTTTLEINAPGIYSVVITYGDCSITKTIEVTQNTNLFEVGIKAECEDNHYMLSAFAINNSFNESTATYLWSGPNGFYGTTQFMDITGLESGIYSVSITNESGCSVTASIEIQKSNCRIPKGVSPNGDGQNDTWDLSGFDILKVKIFNRYGLEIYDMNNYVNQWHGQSFNRKLLPTATYYYYIQFRNGEETTGWVYLNREE